MKKCSFSLILTTIFFFSCASNRMENQKVNSAYVTNSAVYELLPTDCMDGTFDCFQMMSAKFGNGKMSQEFEFLAYVLADSNGISMSLFNEFGTTLATLCYDGEKIEFDSEIFPKMVKPEYIVADFQFCLYNTEKLAATLKKIGVDFELAIEDKTDGIRIESRTLEQKGKMISKITKTYFKAGESKSESLKSIQYENFLRGYSYTLTGAGE